MCTDLPSRSVPLPNVKNFSSPSRFGKMSSNLWSCYLTWRCVTNRTWATIIAGMLPETVYSTLWMEELQCGCACACCYGADGLGFSYTKGMRAVPPNTLCPGFRRRDLMFMWDIIHGGRKASHCKVDNQIAITTCTTNYFIWCTVRRIDEPRYMGRNGGDNRDGIMYLTYAISCTSGRSAGNRNTK